MQVPKNFTPTLHKLRVAGVPEGNTDVGVHISTHIKSRDGLLTPEQVALIENDTNTYELTVYLEQYHVSTRFVLILKISIWLSESVFKSCWSGSVLNSW